MASGQIEVGCFYREEDGSFLTSAQLRESLTDQELQWTFDWRYGEALHFTR